MTAETAPDATEPVWQPHPDNAPQQLAYELADIVDELGYGGQAGGGKTDLGLGLAATKFDRTLMLRREFPQLEGIIDRGNEIFPAQYVSGAKRRWEFDSGGQRRIVTLGSLQYDNDWKKYQGRARNLLVFDEAAEFPELPVRMISGWMRDADHEQHTLLLLLFNPPTTPEGEWIIQCFAPWLDEDYPRPAAPGEIRYFARLDDKEVEVDGPEPFTLDGLEIQPISRTFIPASRYDNPFLGIDYERRLQNLPEPLRSQLLFGDFGVTAQDDIWQVFPTQWIIDAQNRHLMGECPDLNIRAAAVDPSRGGDDETAIALLRGTWFDVVTYPGQAVPDGAAGAHYVVQAIGSDNPPIGVDVIGYGASVYDHLKVIPGLTVSPINVGMGSAARDKSGRYPFFNLRSEIIWKLREALDPDSGHNIALPPGRELRADLRAIRYSISAGKIKVEPKEKAKERLGRSPDRGDAVALAWHGANGAILPLPVKLG